MTVRVHFDSLCRNSGDLSDTLFVVSWLQMTVFMSGLLIQKTDS